MNGWLSLIHPEDRERVVSEIEVAGERPEQQFPLEYRVIWPDESVHWLTFRARMMFDENNEPLTLTGTSFDITDRKRVEEELRESEKRFRSAFNQSAIPMLLISKSEGILRVNEAMCQLSGYEEDELLNMEILKLVHP